MRLLLLAATVAALLMVNGPAGQPATLQQSTAGPDAPTAIVPSANATAVPQSPALALLEPSPPVLDLVSDGPTEPFSATFALSLGGGDATRLRFRPSALQPEAGRGKRPIPAGALAIEQVPRPAWDDETTLRYSVSVSTTVVGSYSGPLVLEYRPAEGEPTTVQTTSLTVRLVNLPEPELAWGGEGTLNLTSDGGPAEVVLVVAERGGGQDVNGLAVVLENMRRMGTTPVSVRPWNVTVEDEAMSARPPTASPVAGATPGVLRVTAGTTETLLVRSDFSRGEPSGLYGWLRERVGLGRDVWAGAYSGSLVITSAAAAPVRIPVAFTIKHGLCLPLVVMLFGVVLGGYLTWYNGRRERDQLAVAITQEEQQIAQANNLTFNFFYAAAATQKLQAARARLHESGLQNKTEIEALLQAVRNYWVWCATAPDTLAELQKDLEAVLKLPLPEQIKGCAAAVKAHNDAQELYHQRTTWKPEGDDGKSYKAIAASIDAIALKYAGLTKVVDDKQALDGRLRDVATTLAQSDVERLQEALRKVNEQLAYDADADPDTLASTLRTLATDIETKRKQAAERTEAFDAKKAQLDGVFEALDAVEPPHPYWRSIRLKLNGLKVEAEKLQAARVKLDDADRMLHVALAGALFYRDALAPTYDVTQDPNAVAYDPAALARLKELQKGGSVWLLAYVNERMSVDEVDTQAGERAKLLKEALLLAWREPAPAPPRPPAAPEPMGERRAEPAGDVAEAHLPGVLDRLPAASGQEWLNAARQPERPDNKQSRWDAFTRFVSAVPGWLGRLLEPGVQLLLNQTIVGLLALGLLVYLGLKELYWSNPTFGAELENYLALFLWGLGAQVTADSAQAMLTGFGLPTGFFPNRNRTPGG